VRRLGAAWVTNVRAWRSPQGGPVRYRNGEDEDDRRLAGADFRSTLPDRNLDDGSGQSYTPLVNAHLSGARAVRLDGRVLVSHLGAAAMPDPEQKRDPDCGTEKHGARMPKKSS
jgi:hypothetical protein